MTDEQPTILLDGDVLCYRVGFRVERPIQWDEDLVTLHSSIGEAKREMSAMLARICDQLETDRIRIAISGENNFRKTIDPEYKAPRRQQRKPLVLAQLRDFLEAEYNTWSVNGLEADDVLSIWMTGPYRDNGIIVSIDKDFYGVPGRICNMLAIDRRRMQGDRVTYLDGVTEISEQEADYYVYRQCLTGDPVDNYSGVPGIGPVKADRLLMPSFEKELPLWPVVKTAYAKAGLTERDAIRTMRLARLIRWDEFNEDTGEFHLWSPPEEGSNQLGLPL